MKESELLLAGGKEEHIHVLGKFTDEKSFSKIISWSKGECSHWINDQHPELQFYWQKGLWYQAVKADRIEEVKKYIENQDSIHKEITFSEEITRYRKDRK